MNSVQSLVANLQSTLAANVALDGTAIKRVSETVEHFVSELQRTNPGKPVDSRRVLELSYESMSKWLKGRHQPASLRQGSGSRPLTQFSPSASSGLSEAEMDPETAFASIMAARSQQIAAKVESKAPTAPPSQVSDTLMPLDLLSRRDPRSFKTGAPDTVQQKDLIIPHEDTVKYRDMEYNLILNSKDRDWLNDTKQNRYHFTVQFRARTEQVRTVTSASGVKQLRRDMGLPAQLTVVNRLQNIRRLEFVKAILPNEGLRVTVPLDGTSPHSPTPDSAFSSVLALPAVTVIVDELHGNNTGTNSDMDKALAVCQYDASWRSESNWNTYGINRGYTLFIPKFMKAQREYEPTPLANLQTMTIRLLDTESNLLSTQPDSALVTSMQFGSGLSPTIYGSNDYIFIRTATWFPMWAFSKLDKIWFQGLSISPLSPIAGTDNLINWLQETSGQMIVGIAHTDSATMVDGANAAGYANWIIIRNRFVDPASGAVTLDYFTGGSGTESTFYSDVANAGVASGGLINLSRQVQITLRAVVRGMDTSTLVRPDNV